MSNLVRSIARLTCLTLRGWRLLPLLLVSSGVLSPASAQEAGLLPEAATGLPRAPATEEATASLEGAVVSPSGGGRPRIGLVLSGGGARGISQVGVLRALEEAGIPIDCIVGASIGAVVGGLYAAGIPIDTLEAIAHRPELFRSPRPYQDRPAYDKLVLRPRTFGLYLSGWEFRLPRSLVNDFNINWMLIETASPAALAAGGDFDRLPIPFRTLALDLRSGELVVLREGDLARAIRSSMAVPLAFPPIPSREPEQLLVDPGTVNNMPIELAREMGCDRIIAVNTTASWRGRRVGDEPDEVALGLLRVLSQRIDSLNVNGWDIWIEPELGGHGSSDFGGLDSLIQAGYEATWAQMKRISALTNPTVPRGNPAGAAESPRARRTTGDPGYDLDSLEVAWVRLQPRPSSYSWVPKRELRLEPGDPFSLAALEEGLRRLYATNRYESVWPWLTLTEDGTIGITLELEERTRTYISVGLLYDNRRKANVDVEVLRDDLFRLGETVHASIFLGDFYNGIEAGVRSTHLRQVPVGFDLLGRAGRARYRQKDAGDFVRTRRRGELATALPWGHPWVFLAGIRFLRDEGSGAVSVEDWDHLNKTLFAAWYWDRTDERELPTAGSAVRLEYEVHLEEINHRFPQVFEGSASITGSIGRLSLTPEVGLAGLSPEGLPFRLWHRLDLSRGTLGRFEPELYAPYTGRAMMSAGFRLAQNLSLWVRGNLGWWASSPRDLQETRGQGGVDAGLLQRTPAGPVELGMAMEEGREPFLFVRLGWDILPRE